jgi:DNA-binding response OmpR family regulator
MPAGEGKRILIVDDEPDLLAMLRLPFEAAGFSVETAVNGDLGVEKARSFAPDVVLLDIVMPGVDGWEVHKRLRSDPAFEKIRIVMMTAAPSRTVESRAKQEGVWRIALKPLDAKQLIASIKIVVAG